MSGIPPIAPYPLPLPDELPAPAVDWRVDPRRAVLLVHDMQEYFLDPFARDAPPRAPLLRNIMRLRRKCAVVGVPVAFTAQPGDMTGSERGLLADFWGPGMRSDTAHRSIVAELRPEPGDWEFTKWRYSAFFRTDLLPRMREAGRDQLVVCGVYAHVGILATALEAFSHDIQPFLAADAVADFSAAEHRQTLQYAARCCARVRPTVDLCTELTAAEPVGEPR